MATQSNETPSSESQNASVEGGLPFKLTDGKSGEIAPEERRIYDHIIYCNFGAFPSAGLTGQYPASRIPHWLVSLNGHRKSGWGTPF